MALRVLLADESVTIKKVIQLALQDFAVEVKAVPVGLEVLEVAKAFQPDLVFADVLLQKRSGYEVCRDLKAEPQTAAIPVVLMFSAFMELDQAQLDECGADGRLEKPFEVENLRSLVLQLVPRTRSQRLATFLEFPKSPDSSTGSLQGHPSSGQHSSRPLSEAELEKTPAIPLGPPASASHQKNTSQPPPPLPSQASARTAGPETSTTKDTGFSLGALPDLGLEGDENVSQPIHLGPPSDKDDSGAKWDMDSFDPIDSSTDKEDAEDAFDAFEPVRLEAPEQPQKTGGDASSAQENLDSDFSGSFHFDALSELKPELNDSESAHKGARKSKDSAREGSHFESAFSADSPFEVRGAFDKQELPRKGDSFKTDSSFNTISKFSHPKSPANQTGDEDDALESWSSQPLSSLQHPEPLQPEELAVTDEDLAIDSVSLSHQRSSLPNPSASSIFSSSQIGNPGAQGATQSKSEFVLGYDADSTSPELEIEPLVLDQTPQPEIVREVLKDPIFSVDTSSFESELEKTQPMAERQPYDRKLLRESALRERALERQIEPELEALVEKVIQRLLPDIAERVIRRELDRLLEDTRP